MSLKVKIKYYKYPLKNTCLLTEDQVEELKLEKAKKIILKIGALEIPLALRTFSSRRGQNSNIIRLSKDLQSVLLLPDEVNLQVKVVKKNVIEIGPLIGVFISVGKVNDLLQQKTCPEYEEFISSSNALSSLCYFFSLRDIDWDKKLVTSFIWENSAWTSRLLPLPTVIYDRCLGKNGRKHGTILRKRLSNSFHIINTVPKLDKIATFKVLEKNQELRPHLPLTAKCKNAHDFKKAIEKLGCIYLKPNCLSKGKGVFRVSLINQGTYKLEYRNNYQNEIFICEDFPLFSDPKKVIEKFHKISTMPNPIFKKRVSFPFIPTRWGKYKLGYPNNFQDEVTFIKDFREIQFLSSSYAKLGGGYLFQQGINLASFKSKPFDLRLLYQKNWRGKWQPGGIAVRIAAPGCIITSPGSGGTVQDISTVLKKVFHERVRMKNGLYQQLIDIGLKVVKTLEHQFGDCVELGLDLAIDKNKHIWILEVNGKPLKVSLERLNHPQLLTNCYKRPIEYAVYLTGFPSCSTLTKN